MWIKPETGLPSVDWLKTATGAVARRKDKNGGDYAIIQGVFVGPEFIKDVDNNATITVLAYRQKDKRWSAIQRLKYPN